MTTSIFVMENNLNISSNERRPQIVSSNEKFNEGLHQFLIEDNLTNFFFIGK
jgi:hypothetical protein